MLILAENKEYALPPSANLFKRFLYSSEALFMSPIGSTNLMLHTDKDCSMIKLLAPQFDATLMDAAFLQENYPAHCPKCLAGDTDLVSDLKKLIDCADDLRFMELRIGAETKPNAHKDEATFSLMKLRAEGDVNWEYTHYGHRYGPFVTLENLAEDGNELAQEFLEFSDTFKDEIFSADPFKSIEDGPTLVLTQGYELINIQEVMMNYQPLAKVGSPAKFLIRLPAKIAKEIEAETNKPWNNSSAETVNLPRAGLKDLNKDSPELPLLIKLLDEGSMPLKTALKSIKSLREG